MMIYWIAAYALSVAVFAYIGWLTTTRSKLNVPLFLLVSLFWPVTLLVVFLLVIFSRPEAGPPHDEQTPS